MSEPDDLRNFEFISSYEYMDRKGIERFEEGLLAINQVCLDKYVHFALDQDHKELICDYVLDHAGENLSIIAITNNDEVHRIKDIVFIDGFSDGRFRYGFNLADATS